ncbi:TAXI family TRAP transporter solute-binding subunit [Halalkalibacter oceani]|uniref:TAXI family TRAP transporter solute-binding subunit n=1 Tax=Halalkalibacter oceani TaxID=1653776 RepID=UPI003390FC70
MSLTKIRSTNKQFFLLILLFVFMMLAACSEGGGSAGGQTTTETQGTEPPAGVTTETINFATSPVGTSANAMGNGLASMISNRSEVSVTIQPYSGVNGWVPLLNTGEVALGADSAIDLVWAFQGEETAGYEEAIQEMRLLVRGNFLSATGLVVREDSGIKSIADLKGKRVAAEFPGSAVGLAITEAALYANGLTWDDVQPVPIPTIVAGIEALQDNRLDATFALVPTAPVMSEAHNATGLYALDFIDGFEPGQLDDIPQEQVDEILQRLPIAEMTTVQPEGYIQEETIGIRYPNYMVTSTHYSDETVYEMMEALWENYEELHSVHPWLETWEPDLMFDPNPEVPYHSGAVQFFQDIGLWNDEVEQKQQELLNGIS